MTKRHFKRLVILIVVGLFALSVATVTPSYGALPKLDNIRVAIFISLPGKYQLMTPAATLSSTGGLKIGFRSTDRTNQLVSIPAGTAAKFALDDFKVKLIETANFNTALAVYNAVKNASGTAFITSLTKNKATLYQVTEGNYATVDEAKAASAKWTANAAVKALGTSVGLIGPMHLESEIAYPTQTEAKKAAEAFGNAGLDTFVALRSAVDGTSARYSVMIGAASDQAAVDGLKLKAASIAGSTSLKIADSTPYMLLRDDVTSTLKAGSSTVQYNLPLTDTKVWVSPTGSDGLKLSERYSRIYRGSFEFSGLAGKLAVVNELPFEQYLYSVVGAEVPGSWPAEALKAQAVAARTYALYQGSRFQIAQVVDTTLSQAYGGIGSEKDSTVKAVQATTGEVVVYKGALIEALFSSSSGGQTADSTEIWSNDVPYLKSVKSSGDQSSEAGLYKWYRVALPTGLTGYVRSDVVKDTGQKNNAGAKLVQITENNTNIRPIPLVQSDVKPVGQVAAGTVLPVLEDKIQSNEMNWIRGPYSSDDLLKFMKGKTTPAVSGPITTLEVTKRGPSGRVTELQANGKPVPVKYPDSLRSVLGSLPSTLFRVESTAAVAINGQGGSKSAKSAGPNGVYVLGAAGQKVQAGSANLYVMNKDSIIRPVTSSVAYNFIGNGYGHGVGLSQYGAKGLADQGYDYKKILQYYYTDVSIVKG